MVKTMNLNCVKQKVSVVSLWEINGEINSGVKDLNDLAIMTGYQGDLNF